MSKRTEENKTSNKKSVDELFIGNLEMMAYTSTMPVLAYLLKYKRLEIETLAELIFPLLEVDIIERLEYLKPYNIIEFNETDAWLKGVNEIITNIDFQVWLRELYNEKNDVHDKIEELMETSVMESSLGVNQSIKRSYDLRLKIIENRIVYIENLSENKEFGENGLKPKTVSESESEDNDDSETK